MRTILLTVCALGCLSGAARAENYSVGLGTPQQDADGIAYNVGFNDFNTALGTLNSAVVTLSGFFTAGVYAPDPYNPPPATVQFGVSTLSFYNTIIGSFGTHSAPYDLATHTARVGFSFDASAAIPLGYVEGGESFQGFDDFFYLTGGEGLTTDLGGNHTNADSLGLSGASEITYNYTPFDTAVPEPASLALLGIGVFGMVAMRRNRES